MSPVIMALLLITALAGFAYSVHRRWRLLTIGVPAQRFDRLRERFLRTLHIAVGQKKLIRYPLAGVAHRAIFFGFIVLSFRSLILFARGFVDDPGFGYWVLDSGTVLGNAYGLIKDVAIVLVILGTLVFVYFRVIARLRRMTLSFEGLAILAIILVMIVADVLYDAGTTVLFAQQTTAQHSGIEFSIWEPLGTSLALLIQDAPEWFITTLWHGGFWTHVGLVLLFLNLLPYTKHFHIITVVPNVFLSDLNGPGRIETMQDIEGRVEREETLGIRQIDEFSWKGLLDLYTCTECGRCTDHCPASRTGKKLSPKKLTTDLRDYLYEHDAELVTADSSEADCDLVPNVIDPEVLWACTTCGACEQECPVMITFVDKIVDMRRYLVQEKGEFPSTLQEAFSSMEVTGSPYGISKDQRMEWAVGLDVPMRSKTNDVDILFWVGCAPATDERAKNVARAVAQLLNLAKVKWAVLGPEESCTGDVARRAGNEFLFQMMAQNNIEILNGYKTKHILTICPHCYNTLKNEYPDLGGNYDVVHHTDYLAQLIADGRLHPQEHIDSTIVYHDSCYLGRYNDIYESPRSILTAIPGVIVVEADGECGDRGMCCGAGGGQMFKDDEPGSERVNAARVDQLCKTGADMIATACPFCMRMMTDALNIKEQTNELQQLDVAEVLLKSVQQPVTSSQ